MKIQAIVIKDSGIHYHRFVNPLAYFPKYPGVEIQLLQQTADESNIDCDILMYNKYCATTPEYIRSLQAKGMKVIVDVDDYWFVPVSHPQYKGFKDNKISELTEEHIKLADVVTCTTMRLQDKLRLLNKNTVVIPNALPFDRDQYKVGDRARAQDISGNDKMKFMYLAGSTHKEDVLLLDGKFNRIGTDTWLTERAEFVLCGYNPTHAMKYATKADYDARNNNYTKETIHGDYDTMATSFRKTKSFKIYPSVPLDHYLNYYDTAHVALAPLVKNEWNSYKSELKLIEAGCKHIPVIASGVSPYTDVIEFKNEGVMFVEKSEDWIKYIKFCIRNPNFVAEQGQKLYNLVSDQYDLIKWNLVRKQLFDSLCK